MPNKEVNSPQDTDSILPSSVNTQLTLDKPQGVMGEMVVSSFYSQERKVDTLTLSDYRRMKDNDGEVQMIISAVKNTLMSAGFDLKDGGKFERVNKDDESEEIKLVRQNLFSPLWEGGMKTDFELTTKIMLRAFEEGFRAFEVIYRLDKDGKMRLDKLAPRASRINDLELQLITLNNGDFYGFHQQSSFKGEVIDVIVVNNSEYLKALNVVYGEEYGSNYGRPALKPVWYHYDKAHKGMFLHGVGYELGAVKFRKVEKLAKSTSATDAKLLDILKRTGVENVVIYDKDKYSLTFESVSDASVMAEGREMINYHTAQIAKALLAQFVEYGSNGNSGNRALGETSLEFFKSGLQSIAQTLIEKPWNRIIADLVKINFGSDIYPTLHVNPIADEAVATLYSLFTELIKKGKTTDSIEKEIMSKTSESLGLDVTDDEIEKDMTAKKLQQAQQPQLVNRPVQVPLSEMDSFGQAISELRPLFPDEEKVKFVDIKRKMDDVYERSKSLLFSKLSNQKNKIIDELIMASRSGLKELAKTNIKLAENENSYSGELLLLALELLEFGKITAAQELLKSVPNTSKLGRALIEGDVFSAVEDQQVRLALRMKSIIRDSINASVPENEMKLSLDREFDSFFETVVAPTLQAIIPKALNVGRQETFKKHKADIFGYRYTAVLDARTTDYCKTLDGRVFQDTDPNYTRITPPNHFGCRSFWVAITKDEAKKYNINVDGKPIGLPTYPSISTFKDETSLSEDKIDNTIQRLKKQNDRQIEELNNEIKKAEALINE